MTPQELLATGFPSRVKGVVFAPDAPTCNDQTYDFFVVSKDIADEVVSIHVVTDAGFNPHSPARLIFREVPRRTMIRHLKNPAKANQNNSYNNGIVNRVVTLEWVHGTHKFANNARQFCC